MWAAWPGVQGSVWRGRRWWRQSPGRPAVTRKGSRGCLMSRGPGSSPDTQCCAFFCFFRNSKWRRAPGVGRGRQPEAKGPRARARRQSGPDCPRVGARWSESWDTWGIEARGCCTKNTSPTTEHGGGNRTQQQRSREAVGPMQMQGWRRRRVGPGNGGACWPRLWHEKGSTPQPSNGRQSSDRKARALQRRSRRARCNAGRAQPLGRAPRAAHCRLPCAGGCGEAASHTGLEHSNSRDRASRSAGRQQAGRQGDEGPRQAATWV